MARSDDPPKPAAKQPTHSARAADEKAARAARIAQEMRMNLKKRKAQARARRERGKPD